MNKTLPELALILLISLASIPVFADDITATPQWQWQFLPGADVPGASGALAETSSGLALKYDFYGGGIYVLAQLTASFPDDADRISMEIDTRGLTKPVVTIYRVLDSAGYWFSGGKKTFPPGQKTPFVFDVENQNWEGHWIPGQPSGNDARSPKLPIKVFCVGVAKNPDEPKGAITLSKIEALTSSGTFNPTATGKNFTGDPFTLNGDGWQVNGVWKIDDLEKISLSITATPSDAATASTFSLGFPTSTEMNVERYVLATGKTQSFTYLPPFEYAGGNPYNIYRIEAGLESANSTAKTWIKLKGQKAIESDLGQSITSAQVVDSKIGVCTHFGFSDYNTVPSQTEIHAIMRNHTSLLDKVSQSGIKWIRDNLIFLDRTQDGGFKIRPYDLDWLREAQERKIRIIACLMTDAAEPLPDFVKKCQDIATQSQQLGLNLVFELGNEPQNFGGWVQKYGGEWNGKSGNSTAPWLLEHLKYTNAGAEAIKQVCPNATVIGLGCPASANFRDLNAGVSHALDGVVDHAYSMTLPPEQQPWAKTGQFLKRDGIAVGDENGSDEGYVGSYLKLLQGTDHAGVGLWITELGFSTYWKSSSNDKFYQPGLTEEAQAAYLARSLIIYQTMPDVKVTAIHNLIDIGPDAFESEDRFGLLHNDETPKASYRTVSRITSLFNGHEAAPDTVIKVTPSESQYRLLVANADSSRDWDGAPLPLGKGFRSYAFKPKGAARADFVALWPEFELGNLNDIAATITISGSSLEKFKQLVVLDLINGQTFDVPFQIDGGKLLIPNFVFSRHPLILRLYE